MRIDDKFEHGMDGQQRAMQYLEKRIFHLRQRQWRQKCHFSAYYLQSQQRRLFRSAMNDAMTNIYNTSLKPPISLHKPVA